MVDSDDEAEQAPMIKKNEKDSFKLLIDGNRENTILLENIAKLSTWFSLVLFVSLTITCIASRDAREAPISIVIGYWLVLFVFGAGYLTKKTIRKFEVCHDSSPPFLSNNAFDGNIGLFIISQIRKYVHLLSKSEVREELQDGSFCFLAIEIDRESRKVKSVKEMS